MNTQRIVATVGLAVMLGGASAGAHHAFSAEFDQDKPVNLEGTITKADWVNPHAWLYIDVKGAGRQGRELGDRDGPAQRAAAPRLEEELDAGRRGHQGRRVCREERQGVRQRHQHHDARRHEDLRRHRRAAK